MGQWFRGSLVRTPVSVLMIQQLSGGYGITTLLFPRDIANVHRQFGLRQVGQEVMHTLSVNAETPAFSTTLFTPRTILV